ncbi:MAG: hypothetical protein WC565_03905 [Parcubacteria group bacterium]|jgi:hypothetical protein
MTKRDELLAKIDELKLEIDAIDAAERKDLDKRLAACIKACRKAGLHKRFNTTFEKLDSGPVRVELTRIFSYDRYRNEISPEVHSQIEWKSVEARVRRLTEREEKRLEATFIEINAIIAEYGLQDRALEVYETLGPESGG